MFECFSGTPLFSAQPPRKVRRALQTMPIPRADAVRPDLPQAIADLLACGLEREPADRPGSAAELLKELVAELKRRSLTASSLDLERYLAQLDPPSRGAGIRDGGVTPRIEQTRELSALVEQARTLVRGDSRPGPLKGRSFGAALPLLSWILYELAEHFWGR